MELEEVQCLVGRVAPVDETWADRVALETAAGEVRRLKSWVEGREVAIARLLAKVSSFPEKSLADAGRTDLRQAERVLRRGEIAEQVPGLDVALHTGRVSGDHVDVLGRALRKLEPDMQAALLEQAPRLLLIAQHATPDEFARTVGDDVRRLQRDSDGLDRLERQRREIRLNTWLDRVSGMGRWSATWDPETMVRLENRLDGQVQSMFHDRLPDGCPSDPLEKQAYLRALALLALLNGEGARVGRPEIIVVEDHTHPHPDGSPTIDWGIPVDLPKRVLDDLYQTADVYTVTVRNGVVIDAPGELNLERSTRLANRAQRRALHAIYSTCAIPGCWVRYSRTKLHHVHWWRHGGFTNLDNLLPVCEMHHQNIHHDGWMLTLTADRTLTITLPDGTTMTTGPPPRQAA
jgi:hypothetical protein